MLFLYLLHFDEPIAHAQHYLGSTERLQTRLKEHATGHGSTLTTEFHKRAIGFTVARVWIVQHRTAEQIAKHQKNAPSMCWICNPENQRFNIGESVTITRLQKSGIRTRWTHNAPKAST